MVLPGEEQMQVPVDPHPAQDSIAGKKVSPMPPGIGAFERV